MLSIARNEMKHPALAFHSDFIHLHLEPEALAFTMYSTESASDNPTILDRFRSSVTMLKRNRRHARYLLVVRVNTKTPEVIESFVPIIVLRPGRK
jgi:hypothetical protein